MYRGQGVEEPSRPWAEVLSGRSPQRGADFRVDSHLTDAFKAYQKAAIPLRTDSAPGGNLIFVEGL